MQICLTWLTCSYYFICIPWLISNVSCSMLDFICFLKTRISRRWQQAWLKKPTADWSLTITYLSLSLPHACEPWWTLAAAYLSTTPGVATSFVQRFIFREMRVSLWDYCHWYADNTLERGEKHNWELIFWVYCRDGSMIFELETGKLVILDTAMAKAENAEIMKMHAIPSDRSAILSAFPSQFGWLTANGQPLKAYRW